MAPAASPSSATMASRTEPPDQIEGVTGRSEAVRKVGGGVDQGPESLGEHAAEGSATDVGCGSTWTGNEPEPAPRAVTPAAPARPGDAPPHSSGRRAVVPWRHTGRGDVPVDGSASPTSCLPPWSSPYCSSSRRDRHYCGRYGRRRNDPALRRPSVTSGADPAAGPRVPERLGGPGPALRSPAAAPRARRCRRPDSGSTWPSTRACRACPASTSHWRLGSLGHAGVVDRVAVTRRLAAGTCRRAVSTSRMPVVVGSPSSGATPAAPFTIHLLPVSGQCQSFPAGVFPVRVQLVDTSSAAPWSARSPPISSSADAPADTSACGWRSCSPSR